ncbi:MAG: hypothetical protein AB7N80_03385 [Bdellovibrionales bacterium]
MALLAGRIFMVLTVLLTGSPVAALDFDKEINKQERAVKVRYNRPPRSLAYFLRHYSACKVHMGQARSRCNVQEAKRRYTAYSIRWQDKMRERERMANVAAGDMKVSLQPKASESY